MPGHGGRGSPAVQSEQTGRQQEYPPVIEHDFDIPFVSELALHEKQIQQNYRPLIAVHKWFARRPGTLFRSLLLAEFAPGPLRDFYYRRWGTGATGRCSTTARRPRSELPPHR